MHYHIDPHPAADEIRALFKKHPPHQLLEEITGRRLPLETFKILHRPELGDAAEWTDGTGAAVNFDKGALYVWICSCHEMVHIFLWQKPKWSADPAIRAIIDAHADFRSAKYDYDFEYGVEQTLAFFCQAACENRGGARRLKWETWRETFEANEVLNFAEKLWDPWLDFLKNREKYARIDDWLREVLAREFPAK